MKNALINTLVRIVQQAALALLCLPIVVMAKNPHSPQVNSVTQNIIEDQAFKKSKGRIAVNTAAGDANLQANGIAISSAPDGLSQSHVGIVQATDPYQGHGPDIATASIKGRAFSTAQGVMAINQVSGVGNAQANLLAMEFGLVGLALSENTLAQTQSDNQTSAENVPDNLSQRAVSVSDTAFSGTRGLVQLNQTAGVNNFSANDFTLRMTVTGAN